MRTLRHLGKDESGMTMGLVVIMILLISVMGAGLLTFVSRDLNTVIEENRGQRAFGLADAGIEAAKRQLASNVVRTDYDDDPANPPVDDIQWSIAKGGLTLNNLDESATTPDSVKVTIQYKAETADFPEHFQVISTGTYGDAKRKIEAIFEGVEVAAGGGDGLGHPLYYTPSDIKIEGPITLSGISMFSEGDILVADDTSRDAFITDMGNNSGGTLQGGNTQDELQDWCTTETCNTQSFRDIWDNWNTVERKQNSSVYQGHTSSHDLVQPGLGAEGKICGFSAGSSIASCSTSTQSIADGVYGYDCTTGPLDLPDDVCSGPPEPRGNQLTFVDKQPQNKDPNDANTMTFPFPRPTPIPEGLKEQSETSGDCTTPRSLQYPGGPPWPGCYYRGIPSLAVWQELFPSSGASNRVVFIDAENSSTPVRFNFGPNSTNEYKGVLVVWCGELVQEQDFRGIILNLWGDGSSFGASTCGPDKGIYRNVGQKQRTNGQFINIKQTGWVYAQGGGESRAGIELGSGSTVAFSRQSWSFLNDAFEGPPPTSFALHSWRELYQ